jgi:hypothetical protein
MVALLPTISSLMGKAEIAVTEQYIEAANIYSILTGFPSSKKSVCLNLFKNEYIKACEAVNLILNGEKSAIFTNNSKKINV